MWNQQGQDYIYGKRKENLDKDPDFQEFADLWQAYEYAKSKFRFEDIPHVMGVTQDGTQVVRVAWIAKRLRQIPIHLQHLKARYPDLNIPDDANVTTTLQNFGDSVEYRDQVLLQQMQRDQVQLPVKEAKLKKEWLSVRDLIVRLSKNRYSRRMDPHTIGPNKQTPQGFQQMLETTKDGTIKNVLKGSFVIVEDLDIKDETYSQQNE